MTRSSETRAGYLATNTLINLTGMVLPLLIGVATIPFVIRGLGTERFGVLSLAWAVVGYFSLFDLGLGRATTKFMAEALGQGETSRIPVLLWSSLASLVLLGILGGILLAAITRPLVSHLLNIPARMTRETLVAFYLLAASVPAVVSTSAVRGALEAAQRFDLVNAVKIPSSALTFLIPAVALPLGLGLPGIILLLGLARLGGALVYLMLCFKALPLQGGFVVAPPVVRSLLGFGGWLTASNVLLFSMVSLDRFLIGSLLTLSAVTYYTAPYEMVTRLWVLPISLSMTLFPAFSSLGEVRKERVGHLFAGGVKYLLLILGPIVVILAIFARDLLQIWLGKDFADKSTLVFQVLAGGVLLSSVATIPQAFLQGMGRPDLPARFYLAEMFVYIGLAILLIERWGIVGAAVAWSFRSGLDVLLQCVGSWQISPGLFSRSTQNEILRAVIALACLVLLAVPGLMAFGSSLLLQASIMLALTVLYLLMVWYFVLNAADRSSLLVMARFASPVEGGTRSSN